MFFKLLDDNLIKKMITAKIIHWIKGIGLYNPMNDRYVNDAPDIEEGLDGGVQMSVVS